MERSSPSHARVSTGTIAASRPNDASADTTARPLSSQTMSTSVSSAPNPSSTSSGATACQSIAGRSKAKTSAEAEPSINLQTRSDW